MAAAADGAPADVASSAKLQSMLEGFGSFERVLQNGTRQRREQDEFRIAELRNIIKDVEAQVAQESDRRVEAAKALQAWAGESPIDHLDDGGLLGWRGRGRLPPKVSV